MFRSVLVVAVFVCGGILPAEESPPWPIVFEDSFEDGMSHWTASDPNAWRMAGEKENQQLDQFQQSKVKTPVRSPFNRALANDVVVGSFQLDVDFKSTARDYPHRSLCLFFGFQDPAHLYYVHFGQRTDDHANQVFIVNNEPRTKISTETTPGTPWDNEWHHARIVRNVESGEIAVYFDDMEKPIMKAVDKTFTWGQIGVGSFDDTGLFDNVQLRGVVVKPEK
ncbi:MAG: hypothetical protein KDA88_08615 [Planctomycetaceae bacterium]|nr:hypothetical protein [Planctomycetaceae bacterium]MCB9952978.1 hypothetical protein [Planctomycetaceae bacterium]